MGAAPPGFRRLYDAELAYVIRTLRRLGVAAADVEDAAHDVFVAAYRRNDDRDPDRPVRPWLFGFCYRITGNYRQKAHRRREVLGDDVQAVSVRLSPEQAAERSEQRELLLRALDELDLEHRAAAVLFDIEGMTAPEIAELLDLPINTVYSRVRNARKKLLEATRGLRGGH